MATTTFNKNIYLDQHAAEMLAHMLEEPTVINCMELPSAELLKGEELDKWFSCNFPNLPIETNNPDF